MSDTLTENLSRERPLPSEGYAVKAMPSVLGTLDLTTIFIVIIFTSPIVTSAVAAGAATFTYWIVTVLLFFVPCVIVTAQLGVIHPHEGSLYNWTHKAFGGYWSFFVGFCAWISGVLVMVSGADIVIGYIQGLNPTWLIEPWQQGVAILAVIGLSAILSVQRFRTVQHFVNIVIGLLTLSVLVMGVAGVVWLTKHPSATHFDHLNNWFITFGDQHNPGNIAIFGPVVYSFLGMEVPLNMGGEMQVRQAEQTKLRKTIRRHLLFGTIFVVVGYLIDTFAVLVVQGPHVNGQIFAFVTTVDMALGKGFGNFVALCIIAFFVVEVTVYNYAYSRLLFVAGVDQRLPVGLGKLNKHRVPANAILFQTIIGAAFTALTFIVIPFFVNNAANLANEVYNVSQAAATLLWVASTSVLFVNLTALYFRSRQEFHRQRIFPMLVLVVSTLLGFTASIVAIVDTLFNSWIVQQIANEPWRYMVGSITLICLIIAGVGSMFASQQAQWEKFDRLARQ